MRPALPATYLRGGGGSSGKAGGHRGTSGRGCRAPSGRGRRRAAPSSAEAWRRVRPSRCCRRPPWGRLSPTFCSRCNNICRDATVAAVLDNSSTVHLPDHALAPGRRSQLIRRSYAKSMEGNLCGLMPRYLPLLSLSDHHLCELYH